ncbi:hypothetical protein PSHT_07642 [Puccinia striiformis]|uniref:Uncharacterized protein n=1 Tax=Puccinia striiformis TaxID=27350 RepID=A0A2S4VW50_9BASI|nr:hypothetical protein PSHT_07642 [Puccinia striiformis]
MLFWGDALSLALSKVNPHLLLAEAVGPVPFQQHIGSLALDLRFTMRYILTIFIISLAFSLVSSAAHNTSHDVPFGDQATDDELGPDTDS